MNSDVSLSGTGAISENIAEYGGGIMSQNNKIAISGNITIRNNRAQQHRGAEFLSKVVLPLKLTSLLLHAYIPPPCLAEFPSKIVLPLKRI